MRVPLRARSDREELSEAPTVDPSAPREVHVARVQSTPLSLRGPERPALAIFVISWYNKDGLLASP